MPNRKLIVFIEIETIETDCLQEEEEEPLVNEPCCACEEAKYEVMFQVHEVEIS